MNSKHFLSKNIHSRTSWYINVQQSVYIHLLNTCILDLDVSQYQYVSISLYHWCSQDEGLEGPLQATRSIYESQMKHMIQKSAHIITQMRITLQMRTFQFVPRLHVSLPLKWWDSQSVRWACEVCAIYLFIYLYINIYLIHDHTIIINIYIYMVCHFCTIHLIADDCSLFSQLLHMVRLLSQLYAASLSGSPHRLGNPLGGQPATARCSK